MSSFNKINHASSGLQSLPEKCGLPFREISAVWSLPEKCGLPFREISAVWSLPEKFSLPFQYISAGCVEFKFIFCIIKNQFPLILHTPVIFFQPDRDIGGRRSRDPVEDDSYRLAF